MMACLLLLVACAGCLIQWFRSKSRVSALEVERDAVARQLTQEQQRTEQVQQVAHQQEQTLRAELAQQQQQLQTLIAEKTRATTELAALHEQFAQREAAEEQLRAQFRNLSNDLLNEQSNHFKRTNSEAMEQLLRPLRENITQFSNRIETIYATEREQQGALKNELKNLMELNQRITTETTNLTQALKGNSKVQGDWGEMLLDTILSSTDLVEGVHYELQANFKDDEHNNLRPDVVLKLPEKKRIVIDAKVSLTAYAEWCATDDATARNSLMEAHLASVRKHVNELSTKKYQQLVDSPDFVVMFIPNEPAFLVALQHDNTIWSEAYKKKVIISSPTNLFAILKLVDDLWRRNDRFLNQEEIIKRATTLFEQLVNFTSSLQGVGASLDQARAKYDEALKRLCTGRNNIVRQGERLRMLGLTPTKQFSQQLLDATDDLPDDNTQSSLPSNSSDPA